MPFSFFLYFFYEVDTKIQNTYHTRRFIWIGSTYSFTFFPFFGWGLGTLLSPFFRVVFLIIVVSFLLFHCRVFVFSSSGPFFFFLCLLFVVFFFHFVKKSIYLFLFFWFPFYMVFHVSPSGVCIPSHQSSWRFLFSRLSFLYLPLSFFFPPAFVQPFGAQLRD